MCAMSGRKSRIFSQTEPFLLYELFNYANTIVGGSLLCVQETHSVGTAH